MRYGFVLPRGDARTAAKLARLAENAGWDGFFLSEPVWGIDAWISLTAAAMCTERIKLGTLLTPLSRMRPWKLASESVTLDHLSGGRVILAVGLGAPDTGFIAFGEETDRKARAELMDEGLDILNGLWNGQPFNYEGKHYSIRETTFSPPPPPIQQPRIPIWVVGAWPRQKSMQRVLRYDGILPNVIDEHGKAGIPTPEDIRAIKDYVAANRHEATPFEIVTEGETPGDDPLTAATIVRPWADAGATWWIEARWDRIEVADEPGAASRRVEWDMDIIEQRITQGPPRLDR